ncbi:hypothetical protein B484DRAFT_396651 [Ochromonadaceae sp. CCMP2298]|nr:hypothetical protein B484DRAFT_396651 [Ochromonadaceae sp. CCMP2298]
MLAGSPVLAAGGSLQEQLKVLPVQRAEGGSLQDQLKALQQQQQGVQKDRFDEQERTMVARQLTYPEGKLVARGSVSILGGSDSRPMGYSKASEVEPAYDTDTATLFILAVGREGPPLAAARFPLKGMEFPFLFEVTSDDLVFPYTTDAWQKSGNSKDTIALTAIISSSGALSKPVNMERFGFGVSNPLTFAGKLTRSPALLNIKDKIDASLYNSEELALLAGVDRELDVHKGIAPKPAASAAAAVKSAQ